MTAVKMMKIDLRKCGKTSLGFILVFFVIGTFVCGFSTDAPPLWVALYVYFGGLTIVANPFMMMEKDYFVRMLPSKTTERVGGRYLYGLLVTVYCMVLSILATVLTSTFQGQGWSMAEVLSSQLPMLGVMLVMVAFEYAVYYCVKFKSPQTMSIIRMVVSFAMFFGGTSVVTEPGLMQDVMRWIAGYERLLEGLIPAAGAVAMIISMGIAVTHEKIKYD